VIGDKKEIDNLFNKEVGKLDNIEFDKRVREILEGHEVMPDAGSWERIASSLAQRRRAKLLFIRRISITTAVVAASIVLVLYLDSGGDISRPDTIQPEPDKVVAEVKENASDETVIVTGETEPGLFESVKKEKKTYEKIKATESTRKEELIAEDIIVEEEREIPDVKTPLKIEEKKEEAKTPSVEKKKRDYLFEITPRNRRVKKSGTLLALSTNFSPSMASSSVTLMSLSQIKSELLYSNVASTIQKGQLSQEVVSNKKFLMPISLGAQLQFPFSDLFAIAAGLNYTLLFTHYDDISRSETRETELTLHYLGIPVNLYYNLFNRDGLKLYVNGGVTMEKGLFAYKKYFENGRRKTDTEGIEGIQWSVNAGVGAEFPVNKYTGLYFDPVVAYYFDNDQPLSIRTSQPLQFKFELGFRFHL